MTDVLIAEDNESVRNGLILALERDACRVRGVGDGAAALKAYLEKRPDLLLLDIMMPKLSGWDVLVEIRKKDKALPILIISALATEKDKVKGLTLGADDYLTKPFGLAELRARVAALLRRAGVAAASRSQDDEFAFGRFRVSVPKSCLMDADGHETPLKPLDLGILRFLAAHPNEVVSRDSLLNGLWGISYAGTTRTIDTRIVNLRQMLGADGARIETVYGSGYRYRLSE